MVSLILEIMFRQEGNGKRYFKSNAKTGGAVVRLISEVMFRLGKWGTVESLIVEVMLKQVGQW